MTYKGLVQNQAQHDKDRLRRARSWLERSKQDDTDDIEKFIFLWIAFNAAYGNEDSLRRGSKGKMDEHKIFQGFLRKILKNDRHSKLKKIIGDQKEVINHVLCNPYIFSGFWKYVRGENDYEECMRKFKDYAFEERESEIIPVTLAEIFYRLYELRNQVFHGGVTHDKSWGKQAQIEDGYKIMKLLVPVIIDIIEENMKKNKNPEKWGYIAYPRVNYSKLLEEEAGKGCEHEDLIKKYQGG